MRENIKLFLMIGGSKERKVKNLDVHTAFLQGKCIDWNIYIKAPKKTFTDKLWKLNIAYIRPRRSCKNQVFLNKRWTRISRNKPKHIWSSILLQEVWRLFPWRCPWCNGYRHRKWTRRPEFKSWTRLIAFHIALIPLGKVWIQLFSLQLWVNSRAD